MITLDIDPLEPRLTALVRPHGLLTRTGRPRIYRFFSDRGELLYLGITSCFPERWVQHRRCAAWWADARSVTVSAPFEHYAAAESAEVAAIRAERPQFNRRSLPSWHHSRKVS